MGALPEFDFSHYFTYAEIVDFLQAAAAAFPHLIRLESLGTSRQGRQIWLATLTDQSTGPALDKPAYWIDANTHAGEVTGSAVALYTIHHLLSQYGADPQATRLLQGYTFYVLPRLAVDGAEEYLTTPHDFRSSPHAYPDPDKKDGLHREDINGDGLILQMRLRDDCGAWKISEKDPRLMVRRDPDEFGGTYYTLLPEGLIHNFDGYDVRVAPPLAGMDFNRNYPFEWAPESEQKGAGAYPFSEPETRAEAEFWRTHRNINGFLTYHTFSAVILRPYSTHPDEHFPVEDLETFRLIGEKGTQLTGYECVSVYHKFRYHPKQILHGGMDDYGYDHWGWFGFTTELWDLPTAAGVQKGDYIQWFRRHPEADDLKILRWNDEHLGGEGFVDWHPFDHPQLGPVEIGGWKEKVTWENAPPPLLPELCQQHCQFTLAHALMSPKLALAKAEVHPQGSDLYKVIVQLENQGFLPTHTSQKALERQIVRPIQVSVELPATASIVMGQAQQSLGHLQGRANKAFVKAFTDAGEIDFRRKLEWVIRAPAGTHLQIVARAERAGTVKTELHLP
ncbi:MAG: M14 family metallopeptidase [Thermostichus sp. BF3_bins_97]